MSIVNRRDFLKTSSLTALPALLPAASIWGNKDTGQTPPPDMRVIKFFGDGESFSTTEYLTQLQEFAASKPIERDFYGSGGVVEALEKKFQEITGKEKAIFVTTGTLANQLAISLLCGTDTKAFVQETSHVFRDEADAAQSVFGKRLIPLAKGETYFTAAQLEESIRYHNEEEVFKSGMGCVSVENPVRRTDGRAVPFSELQKISATARKNNLRLHLDGARIYMASAWTGVSIRDYASLFDTVYISLYKYFGAAGGAILCGDKAVIDKVPHLIKIHGGTVYGNWTNAAMVLHRLEGFEARMIQTVTRATELFASLNKIPGVNITALTGGTNIYKLEFGPGKDGVKIGASLATDHSIRIPRPKDNVSMITVNETLLYRELDQVVKAFQAAVKKG